MNSSTFETFSSPISTTSNSYVWEVPSGWEQGRTAFGGLVLAALVRALEDAHGEQTQPLRSLTATLAGPVVVGESTIVVEVLRRGSGTSVLSASLHQEGSLRTHAVALFGRDRTGADPAGTFCTHARPALVDYEGLSASPMMPGVVPVFTKHFEFKAVSGFPYAGEATREVQGWIRLREPGPVCDAAHIAAHADAWWPALIPTLTAPRPIATVAFTFQCLVDPSSLTPGEPLYHVGRAPCGVGGYTVEFRELWDASGRLIALNQQTIAIIR